MWRGGRCFHYFRFVALCDLLRGFLRGFLYGTLIYFIFVHILITLQNQISGGTLTIFGIFGPQKTLIWRDFCLFSAIFAYLARFLPVFRHPFILTPAYLVLQSSNSCGRRVMAILAIENHQKRCRSPTSPLVPLICFIIYNTGKGFLTNDNF